MNILDVSALLGELRVDQVRYGQHVIQRANGSLPLDKHFEDGITGQEIDQFFNDLPINLQTVLRETDVLSGEEMEDMLSDVTRVRRSDEHRLSLIDDKIRYHGVVWAIVMPIIAIIGAIIYTFIVVANGDSFDGVIYTAAKDIGTAVWSVLTSGSEKK